MTPAIRMNIEVGTIAWYDESIVKVYFYTESSVVCIKEGEFVRYFKEPFVRDAIVM